MLWGLAGQLGPSLQTLHIPVMIHIWLNFVEGRGKDWRAK